MAKNTTNITGSNNQAGGQTVTPQNWGMFRRQAFDGNVAGMAVSQAGTPNMTVVVAPGAALLTINTISSVEATIQTNTSVVISTADTSNARIDAIVVYEDTAVTMPSTEPFSADAINGRFKLASIVGTPAGSPVAPLDAAIQSEIGAGKPWTRLANVTVDANTTTIVNSKIADMRSMTSAKLADGAVTQAKLSTTAGEIGGAWTSWTPTFTNFTKGSATVVAKYTQIGKTVHFYLAITLSGSTMGTAPTFTLPITSVSYPGGTAIQNIGVSSYIDTGTAQFRGEIVWTTTTTATFQTLAAGGIYLGPSQVTASVPHTWANTDVIYAQGTYEAA